MTNYVLAALPFVTLLVGIFSGRAMARDDVKRRIYTHTAPSARMLSDLPKSELLMLLDFAATGKKPTGW